MRIRHVLLAVAAGLALADASIVTLALPQLLAELDTTVEGVASILGVYTVVLAATLLPAERLQRVYGAPRTGAVGLALFAIASVAAGASDSLGLLLGRPRACRRSAARRRWSRPSRCWSPAARRARADAGCGSARPCWRPRSGRRWAAR